MQLYEKQPNLPYHNFNYSFERLQDTNQNRMHITTSSK